MASIKVLLWNKPNKDGLYPIAFRIIKDRKASYMYLGHYIDKDHWDEENRKVKKGHPNSGRLNALITKKLAEYNGTVLDLEIGDKDTSSESIKDSIKGVGAATFNSQAAIYLDRLKKSGRYNRFITDEPRIKRFQVFVKGRDIKLKHVTVGMLNDFKAYLLDNWQIKERTAIDHLVLIRILFNQARKAKILDEKDYPFGHDKITLKLPESIRIGLTIEEIYQLETIELDSERQHHARNLWLFSFYFAGMRASDVLRLTWSQIHDGRMYYVMGKNNKVGSLKISDKANAILDQYRNQKDATDLVFPELKHVPDLKDRFNTERIIKKKIELIDQLLRRVAKALEFDKKLTMHIARHSFGNISGDKIQVQMLQKLYRHSRLSTTINYQGNFIHRAADDALDSVINFDMPAAEKKETNTITVTA